MRYVYVVDTDDALYAGHAYAIRQAIENHDATIAAALPAPSPLTVSIMLEAAAGTAATPEARALAEQLARVLEVADFTALERAIGTYVITYAGAVVKANLPSYQAARDYLDLTIPGGADQALRNGYDVLRPAL